MRGAKRRSNPFFLCAATLIASRSLSAGAHSRDPLARNDEETFSLRQINPTGKSLKSLSSPSRKNIPLTPSGKSVTLICASHPMRGGSRSSRTCGGMRWTRNAQGRTRMMRTAKSCGPDAAVLASNCAGSFLRGDGGKRAVHRGELEVSRKAPAQGRPGCSRWTCMLVCAFFVRNCTRDRGCSAHPAFPAPSDWRVGS